MLAARRSEGFPGHNRADDRPAGNASRRNIFIHGATTYAPPAKIRPAASGILIGRVRDDGNRADAPAAESGFGFGFRSVDLLKTLGKLALLCLFLIRPLSRPLQ
jgi:hypothetical protein